MISSRNTGGAPSHRVLIERRLFYALLNIFSISYLVSFTATGRPPRDSAPSVLPFGKTLPQAEFISAEDVQLPLGHPRPINRKTSCSLEHLLNFVLG